MKQVVMLEAGKSDHSKMDAVLYLKKLADN